MISLAVFANTDFASGCLDSTIIIWSSSGEYKRTLTGHSKAVMSLAVLANGELVSGSDDWTIKIWSSEGVLKRTIRAHSGLVESLVALDSGLFVSGSFDKTMKVWNDNGQLIYTHLYEANVRSIVSLPNGDLIVGLGNGKIMIKEKDHIESKVNREVLSEHWVNGLAGFSNGDFASASRYSDKITVWSQYEIKI